MGIPQPPQYPPQQGPQPQYPPPGAPYAPPPQPRPVQQVDLAAMFRRIELGEALIIGALILMFAFSFVSGWIRLSVSCPVGAVYCTADSVTADTLWDGFGILPAVLVIFGILWFAVRRLPQVGIVLPIPDGMLWMGFAVVEIIFFLLHWVIEGGSALNGAGAGYSSMPGWADFASIVFALVLGFGGYLLYAKGPRFAFGTRNVGTIGYGAPPPGAGPVAPTATPYGAAATGAAPMGTAPSPAPAPSAAVGTLSPDRSHWYDGATWRETATSVPPGAPRSEDGNYWWDGATWRVVPR